MLQHLQKQQRKVKLHAYNINIKRQLFVPILIVVSAKHRSHLRPNISSLGNSGAILTLSNPIPPPPLNIFSYILNICNNSKSKYNLS